jgi:alpha-methylacyl-CoA racemase
VLAGVRVVDFSCVAPGAFAAMVLGDLGADVLRIDRAEQRDDRIAPAIVTHGHDITHRGRSAVAIDLRKPMGVALALDIADRADVLLEGFRPGVMERLGVGPDTCTARNPRLVYGRMTGWGQDGPLARSPGHDINYIAVAGVLHGLGSAGARPTPPANLIGDFGGGGLLLALGVVCALLERSTSGRGQVIDAAMVDGAALLSTFLHGRLESGMWSDERGVNLLDGAAPFYRTYETADGRYVAVGAVERKFYQELLAHLEIDIDPAAQHDRTTWPETGERFAEVFRRRTRDEWCALLDGTQTCVSPVLTMGEAPRHPQMTARNSFVEVDGYPQPSPAPRFSRTPSSRPAPPPPLQRHGVQPLRDWGVSTEVIDSALDTGAVAP